MDSFPLGYIGSGLIIQIVISTEIILIQQLIDRFTPFATEGEIIVYYRMIIAGLTAMIAYSLGFYLGNLTQRL